MKQVGGKIPSCLAEFVCLVSLKGATPAASQASCEEPLLADGERSRDLPRAPAMKPGELFLVPQAQSACPRPTASYIATSSPCLCWVKVLAALALRSVHCKASEPLDRCEPQIEVSGLWPCSGLHGPTLKPEPVVWGSSPAVLRRQGSYTKVHPRGRNYAGILGGSK